MFQLERVYDHLTGGGPRFLVERLWPRGVKKEKLQLDGWLRDVAPSTELRKWFGHDPEKWDEFQRRYTAELEANPEAWAPLLEAGRSGNVTLLFSSHDAERNNAVVLKDFLDRRLGGGAKKVPAKAPAPRSAHARPDGNGKARAAKSSTRAKPKPARTPAAKSGRSVQKRAAARKPSAGKSSVARRSTSRARTGKRGAPA